MDTLSFALSICAFLLTGYMCLPREERFIFKSSDDFNCTETLNCTDMYKPVCGSDGVTYDSMCHLKQEYQRNVCELGNFNPIAFVSNGNCTDGENDGLHSKSDY